MLVMYEDGANYFSKQSNHLKIELYNLHSVTHNFTLQTTTSAVNIFYSNIIHIHLVMKRSYH